MKKVLSIIISIVFTISLFLATFFISMQQKISIFPEVKAFNGEVSIDDIKDVNFDSLKDILKEEIVKEGYSSEIVDYIFEDERTVQYFDTYKDEYIGYLMGNGEVPEVDTDLVSDILNDNIKRYNENNPNDVISIDVDKITNEVNDAIKSVTEVVDNTPQVRSILDFLFNVNYQRYAIYVCLISIIVLIILSGLKALKYMGISFIINAVINIIILLVLKLSPISSIQDVLSNLYNGVVTYYIRFTIIYLIVGIIAIILGVNTNKEKGL